jgi:SIR2-like domain
MGHVFITQGDLRRPSCDDWLLPTNTRLQARTFWYDGLTASQRKAISALHAAPPEGWREGRVRVAAIPDEDPAPRPWLTNTGGNKGTPIEWYLDGARQFLAAVRSEPTSPTINRRSHRLVALPVVGTGAGGAGLRRGGILEALIPILEEEAAAGDFDIALVANEPDVFTAAQRVRKQLIQAGVVPDPWDEIPDPDLHLNARRLAGYAMSGSLVVFLGAGASIGAGLPTWNALLSDLATAANLSADEREALQSLPQLDQALILKSRIESRPHPGRGPRTLGELIAKQMDQPHYSLTHSLVAGLPVTEIVTTNYDTLFELASVAAGKQAAVLPYESARFGERWLLKLHGCVTHPADIVLTREDYLRFGDTRAALSGIVQALLITRHMLFVGFSLRDDNFIQIVDNVHEAVRVDSDPTTWRPFGTALVLASEPLHEELWRRDLVFDNFGGSAAANIGEAARLQEIFLDMLLADATDNSRYLLDPTFSEMLSEDELGLRDALLPLQQAASSSSAEAPAWKEVRTLLARLGAATDEDIVDDVQSAPV